MNKNVICLGASGSSKTIIDILMKMVAVQKADFALNYLTMLSFACLFVFYLQDLGKKLMYKLALINYLIRNLYYRSNSVL